MYLFKIFPEIVSGFCFEFVTLAQNDQIHLTILNLKKNLYVPVVVLYTSPDNK